MAIDTYNLTWEDIDIPGVDISRLPATSKTSLSQADLTDAIEEGAAEVYALLASASLDKDDLNDPGLALARRVIKTYATMEGLKRKGHAGEVYVEAIKAYNSAKKRFREYLPSLTPDATASPIYSNDRTPSDTFGRDINQF